jgi:hypothetical protein
MRDDGGQLDTFLSMLIAAAKRQQLVLGHKPATRAQAEMQP